jgi:nucleotide-binding universal stress UspA family protein
MRVLVALDLSVASEELVRFATRLVGWGDGELVLMHVYGPEDAETARREAGLYLDRFLEHLRGEIGYLAARAGADPRQVRVVLSEGEPVDAILGRASGDDVDMIVMGTHGRTGLSRLFVGSVAEGVLRRASRPVVVVPYSVLVGREIEPAARAGA